MLLNCLCLETKVDLISSNCLVLLNRLACVTGELCRDFSIVVWIGVFGLTGVVGLRGVFGRLDDCWRSNGVVGRLNGLGVCGRLPCKVLGVCGRLFGADFGTGSQSVTNQKTIKNLILLNVTFLLVKLTQRIFFIVRFKSGLFVFQFHFFFRIYRNHLFNNKWLSMLWHRFRSWLNK